MATPSICAERGDPAAAIGGSAPAADEAGMQGREVKVVHSTNARRVGAVLKAIITAVSAVAIVALVSAASVFAMITLAGISPLTLIGTVPLCFFVVKATVSEVAVPLLKSSMKSWDKGFGI